MRSRGSSPSTKSASSSSPVPTGPTDAPTDTLPTTPSDASSDELLTVAEVAKLLRCKPDSVYNLTRSRAAARYAHPLPVMRLPCGLRIWKSDVPA